MFYGGGGVLRSHALGALVGGARADAQRARSTTTHGRSRRGGAGGTRRARAERTDGTFRRDFSKGLFLFCKEVSVTCTCGWRSHRAASLHKFIIICYVRPGQYALFHLKLLPTEHMVHIYTHSSLTRHKNHNVPVALSSSSVHCSHICPPS